RVALISIEDFKELVSIRRELEARALQLSITNGNDDWEAQIVAAFHRLTKTSPPGHILNPVEEEERERRHRDFHMALLSGCKSRWLLRFCEQLTAHLERYRRILNPQSAISTGDGEEIEGEHRSLMTVMINRDADEAINLIERHRNRTYNVILGRFDAYASSVAAE
ncbi:MAG: FCD domain-containing protein, partial [Rhodospirillales bacterium]